MSMVIAILEPQSDGTLHVPVPEELRKSKIHVFAVLNAVPEKKPSENSNARLRGFGALKGKISISPDFDAPLDDFKEFME